MSQTAILNEDIPSAANRSAFLSPVEIFASVQLKADVGRVLHALAIPEYMEVWLQPPGADRIECYSDGRSFDRFRVDLISGGLRKESIQGACLLSKPNRITYSLERGGPPAARRSLVEIRLWSHAEGCTLKLAQSGLAAGGEREWHEKMWQQSLRKLRGLLEGTAVRLRGSVSGQST